MKYYTLKRSEMTQVQTTNEHVKRRKKGSDQQFKCQFINPINHRKCGLQVRKGMKYCFAHLNKVEHDKNAETKVFRINKKGEKIGRVRCPLDPSHTVWADRLKNHLGKCNAVRAKREEKEKQKTCAWFDLNCNVKGEICGDMKLGDESVDKEEFKLFIDKTLRKYDDFFGDKPELMLDQVRYQEGLEERSEEITNKKHFIQQSSLIGQLVKHKLFDKSNLYVEFGCGRAEFSRYLNLALYKSASDQGVQNNVGTKFLMIDRDRPRMKMDKKIIEDIREIDNKNLPVVHRLKVDIKDLQLAKAIDLCGSADVEKNESKTNYVGISKHLCGVATDLTLRCLINSMEQEKKAEHPEYQFKGFLVAMCCRHCCYYPWLLRESKDFLKDNFDIDSTNFKYIRKMCPWATSGTYHKGNDDGSEHFSGLTLVEREKVGLKMRRIIDASRCFAMKAYGFNVQLIKYVPRDVTFENNCMVITSKTNSEHE